MPKINNGWFKKLFTQTWVGGIEHKKNVKRELERRTVEKLIIYLLLFGNILFLDKITKFLILTAFTRPSKVV